jgi:hypothetical protein
MPSAPRFVIRGYIDASITLSTHRSSFDWVCDHVGHGAARRASGAIHVRDRVLRNLRLRRHCAETGKIDNEQFGLSA